jgi:hypothetical protein
MKSNKEFMLLFRYETDSTHQVSDAQMATIHEQWGAYIGNIAIQEKLVSTHQLGDKGIQVLNKRKLKKGVCIADKYALGGNMVINVTSLQAAIKIAKQCPILQMGGTVEVRTIQPM